MVIAAVPPRLNRKLAGKAIESVFAQTRLPEAVIVSIDTEAKGEAPTRNAGLFAVQTDWTAFLDDDDVLYPQHLERLLAHSEGHDLVFPWFDTDNGTDPLGPEGQPWDPDRMLNVGNWIPVTYLVRTQLAQQLGGFPAPESKHWVHKGCVDWAFHQQLVRAGARYFHLPERTWLWNAYGKHPHSNNKPWTEWPSK